MRRLPPSRSGLPSAAAALAPTTLRALKPPKRPARTACAAPAKSEMIGKSRVEARELNAREAALGARAEHGCGRELFAHFRQTARTAEAGGSPLLIDVTPMLFRSPTSSR
jgi:hypothetical protein